MANDNSFDGATVTSPEMGDGGKRGFDPRNRHPDYIAREKQWRVARDVYLGAEGIIPHAKTYVPQRMAGENEKAYEERLALLHIPGLTGALVDSLVGLWARKSPEEHEWGDLGVRNEDGDLEEGSTAWQLEKNSDRAGTTWQNHRRETATWLCVYNKLYSFVDTNRPAGELTQEQARKLGVRPFVRNVSPLDVVDWVRIDGRLIEAVVRETDDQRKSLDDGEGTHEERYLRLKLNGWERVKVTEKGGQVRVDVVSRGEYAYTDPTTRRPRLPLVEKVLPMPRHAAYNLALIELALINHDSHLDSLERAGALGQYLAVQGDEADVRNNIREGDKILPYPPNFNQPAFVGHGMEPAPHIEERIQKLAERFWRAAMYEFSDRPAERTATEVEQEWAAGVGAFLTLLGGAVEEAENEEKALLAQADGVADGGHSKFSTEYRVEDVIGETQRLKDLVFGIGDPLPLSAELKAVVATHMVKRLDSQTGLLAEANGVDIEGELRDEAMRRDEERARMDGLESEAKEQPGFPEEEAA